MGRQFAKAAAVKRGIVLAGLLLAACSGEPSEADMRSLVETHTRRTLEGQGRGGFQQFESFRKQGCVDNQSKKPSARQPGQYDCYYAATFAAQAGRQPLTVNGKGRFTRTDKGLVFEDLGAQPR